MHEQSSSGASDRVIGRERDPARIAAALLAGTTVVVTGSLGSGKSHLLRVVAGELARNGVDPIVLRAGRTLSQIPYGAIESSSDERSALLRTVERPDATRMVVVVDDAQDLDPESAEALIRAIQRRTTVVLVGISVPRARSSAREDALHAGSAFVDLWLHGMAERLHLHEMTTAEARPLLDLFPGTHRLDAMTRATVISLADGSRILLRELAAHATFARTADRDPLLALRDVNRHSRLGDALFAHVAELGAEDRSTMAVIGRLAGIAYTDALRVAPTASLDFLISADLIREDGTVRRRLFANSAIAEEARHQAGTSEIDNALDEAAERMLAPSAGWWSTALASVVAERWHGSGLPVGHEEAFAPGVLETVSTTAARSANDAGSPALAAAYGTFVGGRDTSGALDLEIRHAQTLMTHRFDAYDDFEAARLDDPTLRRFLSLRVHFMTGRRPEELQETVARTRSIDDRTLAGFELAAAQDAYLAMDWSLADSSARAAVARGGADPQTRLRSALVSAMSSTHLGDWPAAIERFQSARRLFETPGAPSYLGPMERVLALCVEMLAHQMVGLDVPDVHARLEYETVYAAHEGRLPAIVLAGLAAAHVASRAADMKCALAELDLAVRRSVHLAPAACAPQIQLSVARAVAVLGRPAAARDILRRLQDSLDRVPPLLAHEFSLTESCILTAEGRIEGAVAQAHAATAIAAASGSQMLFVRDVYQLATLGAADDVAVQRVRRIAEEVESPAVHRTVERIVTMVHGRRTHSRRNPVELLRMGIPWTADAAADGGRADADRSTVDLPPSGPSGTRETDETADLGLTRREREIAQLVAEGLSNREIAERLYLSVRTVESHVYQARAKIGAHSRKELGRRLGTPGTRLGEGTTNS